jgi:hypothetical protein
MSLNSLSYFMQVVYNIRKHYTKNGFFPKHTIFTTIYLLQEHKLNARNYSGQAIIMSNFV